MTSDVSVANSQLAALDALLVDGSRVTAGAKYKRHAAIGV
jgi:hypothetical protein